MKESNITVIAVGGSLIVPHLHDECYGIDPIREREGSQRASLSNGVDAPFLKAFRRMLLVETKKGRTFVLVAGGGKTARLYCRAASQISRTSDYDLHWLGIHATMLNAHFLQTILKKEAHEWIINEDISTDRAEELLQSGKGVLIASGWRPGPSTDHVAVRLAERFGAKDVIVAGDTPYVYDKDPRKFKNAKPLFDLTWPEYQKIIPKTRKANDSAPVDPIAARVAKRIKLTAKLIAGADMKNFQNAIVGKPFRGTIIR